MFVSNAAEDLPRIGAELLEGVGIRFDFACRKLCVGVVDEIFDVALKLGGTLSGEHGIGTAKAKWMEKETSKGTILFSQRMRRAIDPKGLFNACKITGL